MRHLVRCSVKNCVRMASSNIGWCSMHYRRYLRNGDPNVSKYRRKERTISFCRVEGCSSVGDHKGWCSMHYQRQIKHGDPLKTKNPNRGRYDAGPKGKYPLEYRRWANMFLRCYGKNHPSYKNYGAKGITVCDRWHKDFVNFIQDMGKCPPGFWLEREDNEKGYSPENCSWVSKKRQAQNRLYDGPKISSRMKSIWRFRKFSKSMEEEFCLPS
jgi:hypothetical protein